MVESYVCTVIRRAESASNSVGRLIEVLESSGAHVIRQHELSAHATDVFVDFPDAAVLSPLKPSISALSKECNADIAVQPVAHRQKRLVVFDMDSTLIQNECIDMIAAEAGVEPQVAAITEAAMRGELDFSQSLAQRVGLLKGVPVTIYEKLTTRITLTPGVEELCSVLKAHGVKLAVLSGGFQPIVDWIKGKLGLDYAFANTLTDDGKVLSGTTEGRIVDGLMKAKLLEEIAAKESIPLDDVAAVGDGSNDLPMMARAGYGIAWRAKPLVQEKAPSRLNTDSIADALYILGYERAA